MNIVDIHNHLLPGVDDGARTFDESLRHLRILYDEGVTRLAVSPHLFGWLTQEPRALETQLDRFEQVFAELQSLCHDRTDVPRLYFSQEILCSTPEMARAVFSTPRPGVLGTRYALVEFGFDITTVDCPAVIAAVLDAGRSMIVSHPERYRRKGEPVGIDEITSWKDAGAALQLNAGSLVGDYGAAVERTAWRMLHAGLADIISSDHHADFRMVSPKRVANAIHARGGHEQAQLLMSENTGSVLDDVDLRSVPPLADRTAA